jgi:hypothetical protein
MPSIQEPRKVATLPANDMVDPRIEDLRDSADRPDRESIESTVLDAGHDPP